MNIDELVSKENLLKYINATLLYVDKDLVDQVGVVIYDTLDQKLTNERAISFFHPFKENYNGKTICLGFIRDALKKYIYNGIYNKGFIDSDEYTALVTPKTILIFIILHECRHIQQYLYLKNKFTEEDAYEKYKKLKKLDNPNNYTEQILELDANKYAFKQIFPEFVVKSPVDSLDLDKVFDYILKNN